jgi:hypothetical protein
MKRTLKALLFCLIGIPSLAFGMEAISDNELSQITAEGGLSLIVDDLIMYQSFDKISFIDTDGGDVSKNPFPYSAEPRRELLGLAGPASLNIEGLKIDVLRINAMTPQGTKINNQDPHFKMSDSKVDTTFYCSPLKIDIVDETPVLSPGYNYMMAAKNSVLPIPDADGEQYNRIGIAVGLPTIDIYIDELSRRGLTVTTLNRSAVNNGSSMGQLQIKGLDMAILAGIIEYCPHKDSGLDIGLDDIRFYMKIDELRFIDTDGLNTPSANGGPANLVIENITADLVTINALTHTNFNELTMVGILAGIIRQTVHSPGVYDCHLSEMDNYTLLDLLDVLKSYHGQPLLIDTTKSLGLTALVMGSNMGLHYYDQTPYSVGGVMIANGTIETYVDNLKIGGIKIEDPSHTAVNDNASFFPISMKGAQHAALNGMFEISSH